MVARSTPPFMSPFVVSLFSAFTFTTATLAASNSSCYYPSGLETRGSACNPNAAISSCCGPGFVCLSNGLCEPGPENKKSYKYEYYRSSCTDSSWNSTSCPQYCVGRTSNCHPLYWLYITDNATANNNLDAGEGLQSCGSNTYCCNKNYDCCANSTEVFKLDAANIVTTIPYLTQSSTAAPSSTSTPPSASPSSSASPSHDSSSNTVAIGVGVGVGVGVLLAVLAFVLILLRRRNRSKRASNKPLVSELEDMNKPRQTSQGSTDSKQAFADADAGNRTELDAAIKAHIPSDPQELHDEPRYELRSPSRQSKDGKGGVLQTYDGQFFKTDGVYRHEVPG